MSVYAFLLFLIAFSAITAVLFKGRFEQALPCCICYIILIIYISGLIGNFLPGFFIALLTVPVGGIFCLIYKRKTLRQDIFTYVFTPGFFFFTVSIFVMLPWTMRMRINSWDEFSHWGTVIKNFWYLNDFANLENSTTSFKGYPPAASIFAWFSQRFGRTYTENKSYLAYHALYLAYMSPYFCVITKKKEWPKAVIMGLCMILLPLLGWYRAYDVTYVDCLLGVQVALLFIAYALYENARWRNVTICLMTIVICLTKASGVGLCTIALPIILVGEILRVKQAGKEFKNALYLPAIMGISVILGKYSWDIYLKISKTSEAWDTSGVTFEAIRELLAGQAPAYRYQAIYNFWKTFTTESMSAGGLYSPSCLFWILLLIIGSIWYFCITRKNELNAPKIKKRVCICGTLICFPIYAFTLLILYLFTYTEGEALTVASFGRYMGTWLICCCAVIMVLLFDCLKERMRWGIGIIALVFILCGYLPIYPAIVTATPITLDTYKEYPLDYRFQNVKETLDSYGTDNLKVFFVHQQDSGFWYWVCRYALTPYQMQPPMHFSFSEKYSSEQWTEELKNGGYTHVFINGTDETFVKNFDKMFEDSADIKKVALFEIRYNDNEITLHKVSEYW